MNKIYNNLNIYNLIKTDWFEQFDNEQKEEILEGLKNNIDVSIYAKIEFDSFQMNIIRKGLEENLDVSIYANPNISGYEMEEIRKKTGKEINVILENKIEELEKAKKESDWEKVEKLIIEIKNLSIL